MSSITLGMRLHQLIREKGLEQQEAAAELGINRSTFSGYVNDKREPELDKIKAMADFFGVTTDYLLGHSDERNPNYDHLTEELNLFVRDPENTTYIELAKDIKVRTKATDKK